MFDADQVVTIGDVVRMKDFFEKMKKLEKPWNLKRQWQYDTALDIMDLLYQWIRAGKPPVDFDTIFLNESNSIKRGLR